MKKTNAILLLIMMSLSLMSFSYTNRKLKVINVHTVSNLKQYVGEYVYEPEDITIRIYTKEEGTKLYLS
ncbi:hypothetical protein, partial [Winogradskyella sp.]|uniref:hypothetical protein n=1 Tax=Winogradskyella sp. TaxID=1883156 RepID=UPI0025F63319